VRNKNGEQLLNICDINNLVITGTMSPHKQRHQISWISPDGKTDSQIDHVIISQQRRTSMLDTRAMRGADASSDHEIIRSKIRIKLKKHEQNKEVHRKKYDIAKLKQPEKKESILNRSKT
jgi:hypothetical protein